MTDRGSKLSKKSPQRSSVMGILGSSKAEIEGEIVITTKPKPKGIISD
jgi:hypothetical protein